MGTTVIGGMLFASGAGLKAAGLKQGSPFMNSTTEAAAVERVQADHDMTKHLGHWTSANRFEVRARSGAVVLDLLLACHPG